VKKFLLSIVVALFLWLGAAVAQEKVTFSTPVKADPGATEFQVWVLDLRRAHPDRPAGILAIFREVNGSGFVPGGRSLECRYDVDEADALVVALNKTNLSTTSLEKRVTQRCQADGKVPSGTISGTPQ
jgi:hypothetical protein